MRDLGDALKALSDFKSLVRNGLHPSKSIEKVEYEDRWVPFNFERLEFRVGQLTVDACAHAPDRNGFLDVTVWDFSEPSGNTSKFQMGADAEHAARVVVDYLNEYEGSSMSDTEALDRVYMTLGGLQADAKSVDSKMRAGIEYAIERMEAALIEALHSDKY